MGKRSNFERNPRDFYPTPLAAVRPLIPHLHGVRAFAEPCCGDGDLVRHLESFGLRCAYAGDISTGQDALAIHTYGAVDAVITNPPWTRPILHGLIQHFQRIAPTWLLLDSDWANTKQAIPYLRSCTDILPIGRMIWIPGTTKHGKDNAAWYRFDARHTAGPIFHPYRAAALPSPAARACAQCGKPYRPLRSDSKVCSDACRQRAYRERPVDSMKMAERKFAAHRRTAKQRGIPFLLTFDQWLSVWLASGHSPGESPGWMMTRSRDEGGYVLGNVKIATAAENVATRDAMKAEKKGVAVTQP